MKTQLQVLILFLFILVCPFAAKAQGPVNALRFDGIDDYVLFDANNRGVTNTVTVEAWIKTGSAKYHWILGKYDHGADKGYHLIIKDGKAAFAGRDGSGNYRNSGYSNSIVNDNNWHHLAGVCNNGIWLIYVDGILEGQFSSGYSNTNLTTSSPMALGKDVVANNENFNGTMDEVKIWSVALTQEEIRRGMCQKADPLNYYLVGYLKLDDRTGTIVKDHSIYGINGTLQNMSSLSAWVTSGAPVGDRSFSLYATVWGGRQNQLNMDNFSAFDHSSTTKGFHVYYVSNPPVHLEGIVSPEQVTGYHGVFKVGNVENSYLIEYRPTTTGCSTKLFRRNDNSINEWSLASENNDPKRITFRSTSNTGEFVVTTPQSNLNNTIPAEYFSCGGKPVNIQAPESKNATYLWSNGETTSSIKTSELGTHTVTVTENGCSTLYTMVVSADECPVIPNIITPNGDGKNEAFVVEGVEPTTFEIEIFNRWGKSIYQSNRYDNGWAAEGVPAGFYFYHLKSSRSQNTFKGWLEVIK